MALFEMENIKPIFVMSGRILKTQITTSGNGTL